MFGAPQTLFVQGSLIVLSVVVATISAVSGVERGIRRLLELNVWLSVGLILFVLIVGNSSFLLDAIGQNVGEALSRFPRMILDTFAYDRPESWLNGWNLFF